MKPAPRTSSRTPSRTTGNDRRRAEPRRPAAPAAGVLIAGMARRGWGWRYRAPGSHR